MKSGKLLYLVVLLGLTLISWSTIDNKWIVEKHQGFDIVYKSADKRNVNEYENLIENGVRSVNTFFDSSYTKKFEVVIHPNRHSLDSTWQKDWNMPDFKSECGMVGSGVASKLDIISPKLWDTESCEHKYHETVKTQQLITHELVHVFHGQLNASPDFSDVEGMDWFVEGLATYVSGQCDSTNIAEIKKALSANKIPDGLDNFWTGKLRYGLCGSVVMFIDYKYGRARLKTLLPFNKKTEILSGLNITESELLLEWRKYMERYNGSY